MEKKGQAAVTCTWEQQKAELSTLPALAHIGNESALLPPQILHPFWPASESSQAVLQHRDQEYLLAVWHEAEHPLVAQVSSASLPFAWAVTTAPSFWTDPAPRGETSTTALTKQAGRKKTSLLLFFRLLKLQDALWHYLGWYFGDRCLMLSLSAQNTAQGRRDENILSNVGSG